MNKIKTLLNFFSEVGELKNIKRRGIAFYGVEKPDSCAEHTFRTALMVWIFGKKRGIDIKRALKMTLVHNLPKIYAGDITPYDGLLPENKEDRDEFVRRWRRLSAKEKKKRFEKKIKKEKQALTKLTSSLPAELKNEIFVLWREYVKGSTKEGKLVFQVDKLENLIEAFECWMKDKNFPTKPWWEHADEVIDDPELLEFGKEIEKRELKKKPDGSEHSKLFEFLVKVGKLKEIPRKGWVINQIKNPESIADHLFRATFIAWILGKEKELNVERIIKIALTHDLCEVYAGDTTPYDPVIPKDKRKLRKLMKTWPRFTEEQKKKQAKEKYEKEACSLEKLLSGLSPDLEKEIRHLWLDYERGLTPEGRFFKQADRIENFLQALEYWKKYKKPPQRPWWEWAREFFDDPLLLEFIREMDEKFHKSKNPKV